VLWTQWYLTSAALTAVLHLGLHTTYVSFLLLYPPMQHAHAAGHGIVTNRVVCCVSVCVCVCLCWQLHASLLTRLAALVMDKNGHVCRFAPSLLPARLAADQNVVATAKQLGVNAYELIPPLSSDSKSAMDTDEEEAEEEEEAKAWVQLIDRTAGAVTGQARQADCPLFQNWLLGARIRPLQSFVLTAHVPNVLAREWKPCPVPETATAAAGAAANFAELALTSDVTVHPGIVRVSHACGDLAAVASALQQHSSDAQPCWLLAASDSDRNVSVRAQAFPVLPVHKLNLAQLEAHLGRSGPIGTSFLVCYPRLIEAQRSGVNAVLGAAEAAEQSDRDVARPVVPPLFMQLALSVECQPELCANATKSRGSRAKAATEPALFSWLQALSSTTPTLAPPRSLEQRIHHEVLLTARGVCHDQLVRLQESDASMARRASRSQSDRPKHKEPASSSAVARAVHPQPLHSDLQPTVTQMCCPSYVPRLTSPTSSFLAAAAVLCRRRLPARYRPPAGRTAKSLRCAWRLCPSLSLQLSRFSVGSRRATTNLTAA